MPMAKCRSHTTASKRARSVRCSAMPRAKASAVSQQPNALRFGFVLLWPRRRELRQPFACPFIFGIAANNRAKFCCRIVRSIGRQENFGAEKVGRNFAATDVLQFVGGPQRHLIRL